MGGIEVRYNDEVFYVGIDEGSVSVHISNRQAGLRILVSGIDQRNNLFIWLQKRVLCNDVVKISKLRDLTQVSIPCHIIDMKKGYSGEYLLDLYNLMKNEYADI